MNKIDPVIPTAVFAAASLLLFVSNRGLVASSAALFGLLISLPAIWTRFKPALLKTEARFHSDLQERLISYLPYLVVIAGTLVALGPVALGQMPVSQDHANHYFATHILVREMIPSGRFFGWTDQLGLGYPFGDTYHTPSYIVTGLLYLLSFGLIPLSVSYAFGIVIAWTVPVVAVTAWTRRIAGPVGATFAGLAFALDMGSDREGGWIYAMFHGVWAQHFGTGVWVLSLLALWRLTERPTTRRLGAAGLTAGLAMWIHPMSSVILLVAGLLMMVVQYLFSKNAGSDHKAKRLMLVPALLIAGAIGLVWVLRMMLAGDVVFASVAYWQPLEQLMRHLLEGELMENQLAVVSVLGLVGLVALAAKGGRFRYFTLLLPAILVLIGSMAVILESDVGLAGGKLGIMQYRRFSVAAKPFWYAMAGVGVSAFGLYLKSAVADRVARRLPARILLYTILAPFLAAVISAFPGIFRSPVARPLTLERTGDSRHLASIRNVLKEESEKCPNGFCRAVYFEKPGHGGLYPVISMADTGFAWLPTLTLPANNFDRINNTMDIEVMANRGVSVVISKWELRHERLDTIGVFGRHHVYRIINPKLMRAEMAGPGTLKIESWEPERRVVKLEGAGDDSGVLLYQAPYRKWRAEQNGRVLETAFRIKDQQILSFVENVRDGELVLTYHDSVLENLVTVIGVLLMGLCILGIVRPRPISISRWLQGPVLARAYHLVGIGSIAILLLGAVAMAVGGKIAERVEWLSEEPPSTALLEVLHQRNPDDLGFKPEHHCSPAYVRNPKFGCAEWDMRPYLDAAVKRDGKIPSCLSVGVPKDGRAMMTFDLPSGTTHLKGRLHHQSGGEVSGTVGTEHVGKATRLGRPFEVSIHRGQEQVTVVLSSTKKARACLELVAIERR